MHRSTCFCSCILVFILVSCKKEANYISSQPAALHVINCAINKPIMLKINGSLNSSGIGSFGPISEIDYGSGAFFYLEGKSTPVDILNGADTSLLVSNTFDFKNQGIYTLLVAGQLPNVQPIMIEEVNYPFINQMQIHSDADSVINIRFINLSPDTQPLDIRRVGFMTNEVTGLTYKSYTTFKGYPGKVTNVLGNGTGFSRLQFEFLENGKLIKSFTLAVLSPNNRFKNVAIIVTGMRTPGPGQPGLSVSAVNYFL